MSFQPKNPEIWVDREGNYHAIAEMDTDHLFNCIRMIRRRAYAVKTLAEEIHNHQLAEIKESVLADRMCKQYSPMVTELLRRFERGEIEFDLRDWIGEGP